MYDVRAAEAREVTGPSRRRRVLAELAMIVVVGVEFVGGRVRRVGAASGPAQLLLAAVGGVALVVLATVALSDGGHRTSTTNGITRTGRPANAGAQGRAAAEASSLAYKVAAPWVRRRAGSGLFIEPLTGAARHGYGQAMLADVFIREGARRRDRAMLRAGLRALAATASKATLDSPGNPLELLGIATAYESARRVIQRGAAWQRSVGASRRYLQNWSGAAVGRWAQGCFTSPSCWNNYKIIQVAAVLALLDTGLSPGSTASPLAEPRAARAAALRVLKRDLPRAIGRDAEARGGSGTLRGLGVLSDQPTYALAYHSLSVAALARTLELLGARAPEAARDAFRRAMLTEAAFMAPDGDVAYMGRAQGQSWALAASAYAGAACAAMFRTSAPRTAGMCKTLALRAVHRLRVTHGFHEGLFAIVPRFRRDAPTAAGLEHYARVMSFTGLSAMFLEWASDQARAASGLPGAALPLDAGGAFIDRDRSRMAVVRRGPVWFAVHVVAPLRVKDMRYEFGLLSLKARSGRRWTEVTAPRPLLTPSQPLDRAGPTLVTRHGLAYPSGERFMVNAETGQVDVKAGFRMRSGAWVQRGVRFRFRPVSRGVQVTVTARPGSVLRFRDFLLDGEALAARSGKDLLTSSTSSRLSVRPITIERGSTYASSYTTDLRAFGRYVTVPPSGRVDWTVRAR